MPQPSKYPEPKIGVLSDQEWDSIAPSLFKKIVDGERASIAASQAKQLEVRRKIRALPEQPKKTLSPLSDTNWHDYYMMRVTK